MSLLCFYPICVNLRYLRINHTIHDRTHILFLTGKLAQKRLQRVLDAMQPVEFDYEIRNIGVSVAALMTAQMIGRRLK